ncbi:MAG: 2-oxo acid dehydrogenase subunit E2 [Deltaproteobacteria bacterium]|nr:2-oxo acid dehydrogenase subunit E2 [Deltaproteobacteria bacterium]
MGAAQGRGRTGAEASIIRKFTLWWFRQPGAISHVSVNVQIDAGPMLAYLAALAAQRAGQTPKITVQHLLAGAIGRALHAVPAANARVVGDHIVPQPHVGLAMPVNLLGRGAAETAAEGAELGMAIVERVESRNLVEISAATHRSVEGERSGRSTNPFVGVVKRLGAQLPQPALNVGLNLMARGARSRRLQRPAEALLPVTAGLTNPGAALGQAPGARFMGAAFSLPNALVQVGTVWGITGVQDEVVAVAGRPEVRPMLPVLLLFDHRLIDGVRAGRLLHRFAEILAVPALWFGADGAQPGPSPAAGAPGAPQP